MEFTPRMQGWLNITKTINMTHKIVSTQRTSQIQQTQKKHFKYPK